MNEQTKQLIEYAGVLAVVASLLLVAFELRMNRTIAVNDSLGSAIEWNATVSEFIASNSDIWYRGCAGEVLAPEEETVFGQVLRVFDRWNYLRYQRAEEGLGVSNGQLWVNVIARNRRNYPGFNRKWEQIYLEPRSNGLPGPWAFVIEAEYEKLPAYDPANPRDPSLCGL